MTRSLAALATTTALVALLATPAAAQRRDGYNDRPTNAQRDQNAAAAQVPRCPRSLGSLSIVNGENDGWVQLGLQPPARLLRVIIQRSGCFTIVDRAAGFDAAQRERDLSSDGQLQRGSNLGRGQVRSADYVLTAEVAAQDQNTGGGGVAGGLAGALGGRGGRALGGILGGVQTRRMEANTVLSLVDVRTSEQVASEEGYATRSNTSFNLGGGVIGSGAGGGVVGGGYEDTEIGRVVTAAFINAYSSMIMNVGGMSNAPPAAAMAPREAFRTTASVIMRREPNTRAAIVRTLNRDLMVFPTGERDGMWWEVADENDNIGWVRNDNLAPAR